MHYYRTITITFLVKRSIKEITVSTESYLRQLEMAVFV